MRYNDYKWSSDLKSMRYDEILVSFFFSWLIQYHTYFSFGIWIIINTKIDPIYIKVIFIYEHINYYNLRPKIFENKEEYQNNVFGWIRIMFIVSTKALSYFM